jgi:hypothetical protein
MYRNFIWRRKASPDCPKPKECTGFSGI